MGMQCNTKDNTYYAMQCNTVGDDTQCVVSTVGSVVVLAVQYYRLYCMYMYKCMASAMFWGGKQPQVYLDLRRDQVGTCSLELHVVLQCTQYVLH